MALDLDGGEFGVGDFLLVGVDAVVEAGVDRQAGAAGRCGDEVDDDLDRAQGLGAPVAADEAEQAVLDLG